MTLTLYVGSKRYSSWSLRPYLALAHTGIAFETETILLDQDDSKAQIAHVNPAGRVPVLHHDGHAIWDSIAICEYANELVPGARLWPIDAADRARARAISAEMHSSFAALRRDMPMDVCSRKPGVGHTHEALADANRVIAIWREQLAESSGPEGDRSPARPPRSKDGPLPGPRGPRNEGPFLFGVFTIADAMFAPVATRFVTYGVELDAPCRAYVDAIYALPAMRRWLADAEREPKTRA